MMSLSTLIENYFCMSFNYNEIITNLSLKHNIKISLRTLKRRLKELGLSRRIDYTLINIVSRYLEVCIQGSNQLHGYNWMHRKCISNGFVVKQETVRSILKIIDPEGVEIRSCKRLRRRLYFNPGPNHTWHTDCYDKLKPYGISISGCIDGFSRCIVWLEAAPSYSDPRVIGHFYLNTVETLGECPITLRFDRGTENRHIEQFQKFLRKNNTSQRPVLKNHKTYLYGTSPSNQRIESWWSILRKHFTQFWMDLFCQLKDDGYFDGSFVDKNLIRYCFMGKIQKELNEMALEWNVHRIRKSRNSICSYGRPITMFEAPEEFNTTNFIHVVQENELQLCKNELINLTNVTCDPTINKLCSIILAEEVICIPDESYGIIDVYIMLRNKLKDMLE